MVTIDLTYSQDERRIFIKSFYNISVIVKIYLQNDNADWIESARYDIDINKDIHQYFVEDLIFIHNNIFKIEITDINELEVFRSAIFKNTDTPIKNKICVISPIKNEINILPFFIDYYINFVGVNKIIFFDGGSDDGSIEYIQKFKPITEIVIEQNDKYSERNLTNIRNNAWKNYKDDFDWIIVADADEFLYHPYIKNLLNTYKQNQITVPTTLWYEMITDTFPQFIQGQFLPNIVKNGYYLYGQSKHIIFNPKEVNMKYTFGAHTSYPNGNVIYNTDTKLFMLHYKYLSYDYTLKKYQQNNKRRSDEAIKEGHAIHWQTYLNLPIEIYNAWLNQATKII